MEYNPWDNSDLNINWDDMRDPFADARNKREAAKIRQHPERYYPEGFFNEPVVQNPVPGYSSAAVSKEELIAISSELRYLANKLNEHLDKGKKPKNKATYIVPQDIQETQDSQEIQDLQENQEKSKS